MAKNYAYAELFEQYKNLLTEKQQKIFFDYYMLDLSLGEIAENDGVSRQSVSDCIKKVEEQLSEFEASLGYAEKYAKLLAFGEKLKKHPDLYSEFTEIIKD